MCLCTQAPELKVLSYHSFVGMLAKKKDLTLNVELTKNDRYFYMAIKSYGSDNLDDDVCIQRVCMCRIEN